MSTEPVFKLFNRAIRMRIYPNKEQAILVNKTFGCCRFVYNRMLDDRKYHYDQTGTDVKITPDNYKHDYPWLKEVDSLALSNAKLNLDKAFRNFFKGRAGFPKFKSKRRSKLSYTTNNVNNSVRIEGEFSTCQSLGWSEQKCTAKCLKTGVLSLLQYRSRLVTITRVSCLSTRAKCSILSILKSYWA